jgi:IS5 family transposase
MMSGKKLGFCDYKQTTATVNLWSALIALIHPRRPKTGSKGGRPPYPLADQPD